MSQISVIGSNGYIGQHITQKFLQRKETESLYLFDVHAQSKVLYKKYIPIDVTIDISPDIKDILQNSDYIFFFSGLTGTYKSIEEYKSFIEINEMGLLKILECLKRTANKNTKIIFPSTRLIYKGIQDKPLKEDDEKEFKTVYAVTKYACEQYLKMYQNLFGINYTIFRICVPYGNLVGNDLSYGTLSHFIQKAKSGEDIILYGDGQLKRTFTHIDDLTEMIIYAGTDYRTNNNVFNIGSNDHLSLYEVAKSIADIYNVKVRFIDFPTSDFLIESGDTIFDDTKLKDCIPFSYSHLFHEWIKDLK